MCRVLLCVLAWRLRCLILMHTIPARATDCFCVFACEVQQIAESADASSSIAASALSGGCSVGQRCLHRYHYHLSHLRSVTMRACVLCVCFLAVVARPSDVQLPLPRQDGLARLVRVRRRFHVTLLFAVRSTMLPQWSWLRLVPFAYTLWKISTRSTPGHRCQMLWSNMAIRP